MARKVVVEGLGFIGLAIADAVRRSGDLQLAALIDVDPAIIGTSPIAGGPAVVGTLDEALAQAPDTSVFLHATGSWLPDVAAGVAEAVNAGLHVVSTCEQLAWPWPKHPGIAAELHATALTADRTVVATGVNPGFIMDRLPALIASVSRDVRRIRVERRVDPRPRREAFRRKVGVGMDRADLDAAMATGRFGHVGLDESAHLLAASLGWRDLKWKHEMRPVLGNDARTLRGVEQTLTGTGNGRTLELVFVAHTGVDPSEDRLEIDGEPPSRLVLRPGLPGEEATIGAVLGAVRVLDRAPRGLISVLDLPLLGSHPADR